MTTSRHRGTLKQALSNFFNCLYFVDGDLLRWAIDHKITKLSQLLARGDILELPDKKGEGKVLMIVAKPHEVQA